MFAKILCPVDLAHVDRLGKALKVAADLGTHYGAPVCYVGVTTAAPSSVAHNPTEFEDKLTAFGEAEAAEHGHDAGAMAIVAHDPAVDLDDKLMEAVRETGSDLVVMASHIPGMQDFIWPSNGGKIASHSAASVMVVRES